MATSPEAVAAERIAGWDIGGVHLKGAVIEAGTVVDAFRIPAALWTGLDALEVGFDQALGRIGPVRRHAVTLTGELSDLFEDRAHGVERIVAVTAARLGAIRVYAGHRGCLAAEMAAAHAADVASANWHAAAALVASRRRDALLVDVGSTTTDLVPVADGTVRVVGYTDAERLAAGELLYTGATRTPVMAVAHRVPFAGSWQPLVAEHFATTADGRGKSPAESRSRLARMLGRDAKDASDEAWLALAHYLGERQLALILDAAALVLSRGTLRPDAPLVGAGIGRFLTQALGLRLGRAHVDFEDLVPMHLDLRASVAHAAPAVAVALLAEAGEGPGRQGAEAASRP